MVMPDGSASDWMPLVTLVRLPTITALNCPTRSTGAAAPPAAPKQSAPSDTSAPSATPTGADVESAKPVSTAERTLVTCGLTGSDLFLIDSVSADAAFTSPARLPEGFVQNS